MTTDNGEPMEGWPRRLGNWITAHWWLSLFIIVAVLIFLLLFYWTVQPAAAPQWAGFAEITSSTGEITRPSRTVWDWLDLLIVPAVLAAGLFLISRSLQANNLRSEQSPELLLYKEGQERIALESYFDRMEKLLLDRSLRSTNGDDKEVVFARARTLAVLPNLDSQRKGQVIRFLSEAQLIDGHNPIIELRGAEIQYAHLSHLDLSKTNLSGANLSQANLHNSKLKEANLSQTNLSNADLGRAELRGALLIDADLSFSDLSLADLRQADLSRACLIGSDLSGAHLSETLLSKVDLSAADLSGAYLSKADLREANLSKANLSEVNLSGADLSKTFLRKAILNGANLGETNLSYADLSGADLRGAILREANLFGANLSEANLVGAQYSQGTKWPPDGFKLEASGAIWVNESGQPIEGSHEEA